MVISFIGLAYEQISSYLNIKRQNALQKAFRSKGKNVDLARNKIYHLENSMIIYGIYIAETVEKITNITQKRHNETTQNARLFSA